MVDLMEAEIGKVLEFRPCSPWAINHWSHYSGIKVKVVDKRSVECDIELCFDEMPEEWRAARTRSTYSILTVTESENIDFLPMGASIYIEPEVEYARKIQI